MFNAIKYSYLEFYTLDYAPEPQTAYTACRMSSSSSLNGISLLYTSDLPELGNSTVATFADDTAILAVGTSSEEPTGKLQTAINQIQTWKKKEHPA
jgi:hypothetical protein